ncbi:MAG: hypothetical protein IPO71_02320 [Nitrosomonas sp.]|nr:hypothetical protein [Nitrosomonas sp.]
MKAPGRISSSVTYTLPANVENLTLTGTTAINGQWQWISQHFDRHSAINQLNGGGGTTRWMAAREQHSLAEQVKISSD